MSDSVAWRKPYQDVQDLRINGMKMSDSVAWRKPYQDIQDLRINGIKDF